MLLEYFAQRSTPGDDGCILWVLHIDRHGYGKTHWGGANLAHRASYEAHVGPIPDGMTIDHVCFQKACINPDHLRPMSREENSRRQKSAEKSTCVNGHAFDEGNTYWRTTDSDGRRSCRACNREARRRYRQRRSAA